jgi:hypothetical protein
MFRRCLNVSSETRSSLQKSTFYSIGPGLSVELFFSNNGNGTSFQPFSAGASDGWIGALSRVLYATGAAFELKLVVIFNLSTHEN